MNKIKVVGLLDNPERFFFSKDILCYFILDKKMIQKDSFG